MVYLEDIMHEVLSLWQERRQGRLRDLRETFSVLSPEGKDEDLVEITYHQLHELVNRIRGGANPREVMKCYNTATESADSITIEQWVNAVARHNIWRPKVSQKAAAKKEDKHM